MGATAKIFMNGRSQAVRLPAEFRFEGTEVDIRRDEATGNVILSAKRKPTGNWEAFFALQDQVPAEELKDFMIDRDQGESQRDDIFDDV